MAKDAQLVNVETSPWRVLLLFYGCVKEPGLRRGLRPCCWRRPLTGPCADSVARGARWDWRSCKVERKVRLALQGRHLAPTTDRLARGETQCVPRGRASADDVLSDPDSGETDEVAMPLAGLD